MLCLTVYVYNFILLLQNVQCRDTDVHAGGLLETESSAYEGEKASEQRSYNSDVFISFQNQFKQDGKTFHSEIHKLINCM